MPALADHAQHEVRLNAALETVDRVFAEVPRPGPVDGCGYCYSDHDLELLGGDVRAVPDDLVRHFAHEVPDHWSLEQYGLLWRGLAPRILRTAASDRNELIIPWALRGPGAPEARFYQWPQDHPTCKNAADALVAVEALAAGAYSPGNSPTRATSG